MKSYFLLRIDCIELLNFAININYPIKGYYYEVCISITLFDLFKIGFKLITSKTAFLHILDIAVI